MVYSRWLSKIVQSKVHHGVVLQPKVGESPRCVAQGARVDVVDPVLQTREDLPWRGMVWMLYVYVYIPVYIYYMYICKKSA